MMKTTTLFAAALLLGGILGGCSAEAPADNNSTEPTSSIEGGTTTPVVFANDKGVALCPVMGDEIKDTAGLKYEDYEGKRYYFCCDVCPEKFHAEPAKYADGKAMPAEGTM
ncbi:MAG: YHS domain-containing protein [Fimbriimonadales bacterium]